MIPRNEGYTYLFQDNVYIPVFNTVLRVTKRITVPLNLVEEKVLQLIDAGVYQIDEMSNILGLHRKLLDITIADLYVKEFITTTSDSCKILLRGRSALNELASSEKRQDIMKEIYMNSINGDIIRNMEDYDIIDKVREDDNKLKPSLKLGNVQDYLKKYKEVKELFEKQNKEIEIGNTRKPSEELISIDNIENIYVQFIKVPICVFVSNNGVDIDILCRNNKMVDLIADCKDAIIRQIVDKKVLKNHFSNKKLKNKYNGIEFVENSVYVDELKRYYFFKQKTSEDREKIENIILSSRKLYPGEYEIISKYLSSKYQEVTISVDRLEDWVYSNSFIRQLVELDKEINVTIEYGESAGITKSQKQIGYNYNKNINYIERDSGFYISWNFGNQYRVYGIPHYKKVISEGMNFVNVEYYMEKTVN